MGITAPETVIQAPRIAMQFSAFALPGIPCAGFHITDRTAEAFHGDGGDAGLLLFPFDRTSTVGGTTVMARDEYAHASPIERAAICRQVHLTLSRNSPILDSLARCHQEELLREAELLRSVRRDRPYRVHLLRGHAVRILRALGGACLSLSDELANASHAP